MSMFKGTPDLKQVFISVTDLKSKKILNESIKNTRSPEINTFVVLFSSGDSLWHGASSG